MYPSALLFIIGAILVTVESTDVLAFTVLSSSFLYHSFLFNYLSSFTDKNECGWLSEGTFFRTHKGSGYWANHFCCNKANMWVSMPCKWFVGKIIYFFLTSIACFLSNSIEITTWIGTIDPFKFQCWASFINEHPSRIWWVSMRLKSPRKCAVVSYAKTNIMIRCFGHFHGKVD